VDQPPKPPQQNWLGYWPFGLLFLVSGFAGYLAKIRGDQRRFSWFSLLSHLTASGTAGTITVLICVAADLSMAWAGALSGMAGYAGPTGMDWVAKVLSWRFGLELKRDRYGRECSNNDCDRSDQ
jgi:hypothetical protein